MIKRTIPERYQFTTEQLNAAITSVLGPVTFHLKGRLLIIDANPTGAQLTAIKAAFLAAAEDVAEL